MANVSFKSHYPISLNCPKCGSFTYQFAKPEHAFALRPDRICSDCDTRYTPPVPVWGRVLYVIFGIGALVGCGIGAVEMFKEGNAYFPIAILGAVLGGGGCIYQAITAK